jgi:hypothetical protein
VAMSVSCGVLVGGGGGNGMRTTSKKKNVVDFRTTYLLSNLELSQCHQSILDGSPR